MGRLIDLDKVEFLKVDGNIEFNHGVDCCVNRLLKQPTVEAIPKVNVYKAIQEMMKYEHEGFINISLARLDEILKKCGVSEDAKNT